MLKKKGLKTDLIRAVVGCFFVIMGLFGGIAQSALMASPAYAEENTAVTEEDIVTSAETKNPEEEKRQEIKSTNSSSTANNDKECKKSLGALGWLVCPATGKISEAVDWLYEKIEDILVINPVEIGDGSPIYEIWKYCRGVTNIVFIIFLLVVIYSQITGVGINNYGIKKILPKLIIAAVLVNLSFLICSLAVDLSNIIGSSLRGVFTSVQEATLAANGFAAGTKVSMTDMFLSLAGGTALAVGAGVVAFELGAIWMLIPTVLGAIVAVASGLITIALRQAVVALLIMISPLAFVAYMLPNTEDLYKKWKKLLIRMLTFYPLFSLLFGASQLAGFAIIASAKDGFWLLLGVAIQIFPLFFSWKLMSMSGTFLGDINSRLRGLAAKPLATNRAWADSHRQLSKQKHLASDKAYTPSLRLMQFMSNRKVARDEEMSEHAKNVKLRGQAYNVRRKYGKNGMPGRGAEEDYAAQAKNMEYEQIIERHKNNMNKGLGQLAVVQKLDETSAKRMRLDRLDAANVKAADTLFAEKARGEKIEYDNAMGRHKRFEDAINAHFDDLNSGRSSYRMHDMSEEDRTSARARYSATSQIMEGNMQDIQFAAANAAQSYDTQKKIVETKMQKYFELTPPTKDVEYRLGELTKQSNAAANIDSIVAGLRILNQRGDTDLLRKQVENVLNSEKGIQLGTHASQSLASFLMFEVKDNDPSLRRLGKYINLETAQIYNKNKRQNPNLTLEEYITGEYEDWAPIAPGSDPNAPRVMRVGKSKRPITTLLEGTSFDNVERTAYSNLDEMLVNTYTKNGKLDEEAYFKKRNEIETAIGPQFISASLKYLSGSEQLKNAVSFLTGYNDGVARWEDEGDSLYGSKEAEEYFRGKTMKYLKDQTPSQILGLRSDYYNALSNHLINEYEETEMDGWSDEAIAEHKELMKEKSEIQTRYGDLPAEEAQRRREADVKALKEKMAGAQFRQVLDSKGKLNQIYRTRRSGAANNAKDWVRGWLDLDNEVSITKKLEDDRKRLKTELERERKKKVQAGDVPAEEGPLSGVVYDDKKRVEFVGRIDEMWNDLRDEDDEVFFKESLGYVEKELGKGSYIAVMYKRYREDDPYADSHALKDYLEDLLRDAENY